MSIKGKALDVVVVEHSPGKVLTAFFRDYPGIIVQCTEDELDDKIETAWISYVNRLNSKREFVKHTQKIEA